MRSQRPCSFRIPAVPLILFVLALSLPMFAVTPVGPNSRAIDSGWEFRAISGDRADTKEWRAAKVPGVVHTDLLRHKLIPDPFYRDNDAKLQWVGLTDWEYRTTVQVDAATLAHQHVDLVFEGLDTYAEVFVNDQPVLKADNMFRRWRVPAKSLLKPGANSLRVVFQSAVTSMIPKVKALPYILPSISTNNTGNEENIATAPYTRKAPYNYGWDWGPRYMTMGVWQPVRLETWDAVRIEDFHIRQVKISKEQASLVAEFEIEADAPTEVRVVVTYTDKPVERTSVPADGDKEVITKTCPFNETTGRADIAVTLDKGKNRVSLPIRITNPKLWYPNGYGPQDRYGFTAHLLQDGKKRAGNPEVTRTPQLKTGLRSVELRREYDQWGRSFTFVINGLPVFAKGANVIPFDSFPDRVTPELQRKILTSARDANMNMLRNWGGAYYEADAYYDICDELGILIWQDFMFGGDMVPGDTAFQENVRQEAIEQVKRLRHHPSVVLWNGNNEVETGWQYWGDRVAFRQSVSPTAAAKVWQDYIVLFHDVIKSVVKEYGDGIPYWPSSPSFNLEEFPPDKHAGDAHYWAVWHAVVPIEEYTNQYPRFMSEYGFQSFPEMRTIRSFATPEDLDIRSATMQAHQKNKGGNERILAYMLRWYREPKDFPSFVYMSQVLQAEAIKVGAEHLRRQRPRVMGSLYWQLNDCWPVASWSSVDYYGRWKALQYYTRRFYADVLVSPWRHDGKVEVFVVNDKQQSVSGNVRLRLLDFSGKVISEKTQAVQAPAASSAAYLTLDEKELLGNSDPRAVFAVVDFDVDGQRVSRNMVYFDVFRNMQLPASPKIEGVFEKSADGYNLTLKSPVLAPNVFVSFGDLETEVADNYIDLLPGEAVTIAIKTAVPLEQLKASYQVVSVTDASAPMVAAQPAVTSGN